MAKVTRWISITERCALLYRMQAFEELGLTGCQHMYIFYLCNHPDGISQEALAKKVYINKSNAARNLKALEEAGFVLREVDEADKRAFKLYPTKKAYDAFPKIKEKLQVFNEALLDGLSEEEQIALETALQKVAKNASTFIDEHYED